MTPTPDELQARLLLVLETIAVREPGLTVGEALPIVIHALKHVDWAGAATPAAPFLDHENVEAFADYAQTIPAVMDALVANNLIDAIKALRAATGASLLSTKRATELLRSRLRAGAI